MAVAKLDPFTDLDKRSRLALRQALQSGTGSYAAPAEVVKKLERKKLVQRSGHVHAAEEWGKVIHRWPIFWLTDEGKQVAQQIVDTLHGQAHSTIKSSAQLDAEIAEALAARPVHSARKVAATTDAIHASEAAKRRSDDAFDAAEHRAAAEAHRRAGRLHKSDPAGADAAWLHDLAAINHRQAATARASRALHTPDPARTKKTFAAFKEKLSAATEHTSMAQEYARQALAAARRRS